MDGRHYGVTFEKSTGRYCQSKLWVAYSLQELGPRRGGRFLMGVARDKYGTRRTTMVSLLCVVGGSIGIGLSDPNGASELTVSLFLLGFGSGAQLCMQPVAGLFLRSGTVISTLSGAFQISGLMFWVLTRVSDKRAYAFCGYAVLVSTLAFIAAFMLPFGPSFILPTEEKGESEDEEMHVSETAAASPKEPDRISRLHSYSDLLLQREYLALVAWFSISTTPMQYYVGSIGFQLEEKGDNDGYYTTLFPILYASVSVLAPLGGYTADVLGLGIAQAIATSIVSSSMFMLASDASLSLQSIGLGAYGIGRMLTFGLFFCNVGKRFGYANYGLLSGVGLLLSAILSLVQYPLINIAADGKAKQVNIACGAVLISTLPYCFWLYRRELENANAAPVLVGDDTSTSAAEELGKKDTVDCQEQQR